MAKNCSGIWNTYIIICDPSREKGQVGCHIVKFTFSAF